MSDPTDREIAERTVHAITWNDIHGGIDNPKQVVDAFVAALTEQREQMQRKHQEEIDLLIRAKAGEFERAEAAEADLAKLKHIDKSEMLRLLRIAEDKIRDLESALRDLTAIQQDRIAELEADYDAELEADGRRKQWMIENEGYLPRKIERPGFGNIWWISHPRLSLSHLEFDTADEAIDAAIAAEGGDDE